MFRPRYVTVALYFFACGALATPASLFDVYAEALLADPRVKIAQHKVEMGKAQQDSN